MREKTNLFEEHPRATLVAFVLVVILVLDVLTTLVSVAFRQKAVDATERSYRIPSQAYHHDLAPNVSISNARWGERTYSVRTNSLGFKDGRVWDVPLKSDEYRVLFIGDSFTEGIGVEYRDTFVGRIADTLKSHGISVFNAAVASYSPTIYLAKIRYLMEMGFDFDEVVVCLDISDPQDEAVYYDMSPDGSVEYRPEAPDYEDRSWQGRFARWIDTHTTIARLVLDVKSLMTEGKTLAQLRKSYKKHLNETRGLWTLSDDVYEEYGKRGLELMEERMNKLSDLLSEKNITLTLVVYPWKEQILADDLDSKHVLFWKTWAERRKVKLINLFPRFIVGQGSNVVEKYLIKGDVHWNEAGNMLVADGIMADYYGPVLERSRLKVQKDELSQP